jgi:hypothetical protein
LVTHSIKLQTENIYKMICWSSDNLVLISR